MRWGLVSAGIWLAVSGCAAGLQGDIRELQQQQVREQERLDQIQADIVESEREAERAREAARFERCRALVARVDATVEVERAECLLEDAQRARCEADNSRRGANSTLWGCLAGIGVALVTAGGAAPVALGGCGVGYMAGRASQEECTIPSCLSQPFERSQALDELRTEDPSVPERLPPCGGWLGIVASTHERHDGAGVPVLDVRRGTTGAAAGLREGDLIIAINGHPITNNRALGERLREIPVGAEMVVQFIRERTLVWVRVQTMTIGYEGRDEGRTILGVSVAPLVEGRPYAAGAVVAEVVPGSPADLAGLRTGDVIVGVNGNPLGTVRQLEDALRLLPAESSVTFTLLGPDGTPAERTGTLGLRGERQGL